MKYSYLLLFVVVMPLSAFAGGKDGYGAVPNAAERAAAQSAYVPLPGFPRTHLVNESDGEPDSRLMALITDPEVRKKLANREFTSLQLRELFIKTNDVYSEEGVIHFPFAISLKHTQGPNQIDNFNQGTIDCAGEIFVVIEGNNLRVEVTKFYDSQRLERWGRRWAGYNADINLAFAKAIIKPVLENWFNSNPDRVQTLLKMTGPPISRL